MAITLHQHLTDQAARKGIPLTAVRTVLAAPAISYKSFTKDGNGKRVPRCCNRHGIQQDTVTGTAEGRKLAISVAACCNLAITVWMDQAETELREDQKAKGVTKYRGKDGNWRQ
jgi:hypothetical protein